MYSMRNKRSFRKKVSYAAHPTRSARANRVSARNARQRTRKNVQSLMRGTKKSFVGGFFEKFVSDLKNTLKV